MNRNLPGTLARAGVAAGAVLLLAGCGGVPNRVPLGETFPSVRGEALSGERITLPSWSEGHTAVYIVAYRQRAQFDVDRWLLGLAQMQTPVELLEVPTIRGWVPRLVGGVIDEGMRGGIPREDWGSVVTVYGDAERIVAFTGNENGNNARVVLLDGRGTVRWFHDRGYSARQMLELDKLARELEKTNE
jgi:hypothetical protein